MVRRPPRNPFPATVPPIRRLTNTSYSKVSPELIQEELVDQAERQSAEAEELRAENALLKRDALRQENELLRQAAERRPSIDSRPPFSRRPKGGIWIAPGTLATVVSIVLGGGGIATGGVAYWQAERRAEKPIVQTHVTDLTADLKTISDDVSELQKLTADITDRIAERDCWVTGVLVELNPGLKIRLPEDLNCSEVKVERSILRQGAKRIMTVSEPYPE